MTTNYKTLRNFEPSHSVESWMHLFKTLNQMIDCSIHHLQLVLGGAHTSLLVTNHLHKEENKD